MGKKSFFAVTATMAERVTRTSLLPIGWKNDIDHKKTTRG
jgi:hypothetical protein